MHTLNETQIKYLVERCDENSYGRIMVSSYLVKKYREFTGEYNLHDTIIRTKIQRIYETYGKLNSPCL